MALGLAASCATEALLKIYLVTNTSRDQNHNLFHAGAWNRLVSYDGISGEGALLLPRIVETGLSNHFESPICVPPQMTKGEDQ